MKYLSEMVGHRCRYVWSFWLIITGLGLPLGSALAADLAWPANPESPLTAPASQLPAHRVSFAAYSYIATEEVGQAVITVTVDPPAPNVVQVNYSMAADTAQAGQDYEPVGGTLQIPPNTAFVTYTIPITDDDLTEFDETVTLYLSFAFGAQLWPPSAAGLIIRGNDPAGVNLSQTQLQVAEPTGREYITMTLDSEPAGVVTFDWTASNQECLATPNPITVTNLNWRTGVSVTVAAVDDFVVDGEQPCLLKPTISQSDDQHYNKNLPLEEVAVTVLDDDVAGITIRPLTMTLRETTTTDYFTITLNSQPVNPVNITFNHNLNQPACLLLTETVSLTPLNWQTGISLPVRPVDDQWVDGPETCVIDSAVVATLDESYQALTVPTVTVTVLDDEVGRLKLTPDTLDFRALVAENDPAAQSMMTINEGSGLFTWTAHEISPWLTLTPLTGTVPTPLTATVNISGLAIGSYSSTVALSAAHILNSPQLATVSLTIAPRVTISESVAKAQVSPGEQLSYTLTVSHVGELPANGLELIANLPADTRPVNLSPTVSYSETSRTVRWSNLTLAAGESLSRVVMIQSTILTTPLDLILTNTVMVSLDGQIQAQAILTSLVRANQTITTILPTDLPDEEISLPIGSSPDRLRFSSHLLSQPLRITVTAINSPTHDITMTHIAPPGPNKSVRLVDVAPLGHSFHLEISTIGLTQITLKSSVEPAEIDFDKLSLRKSYTIEGQEVVTLPLGTVAVELQLADNLVAGQSSDPYLYVWQAIWLEATETCNPAGERLRISNTLTIPICRPGEFTLLQVTTVREEVVYLPLIVKP